MRFFRAFRRSAARPEPIAEEPRVEPTPPKPEPRPETAAVLTLHSENRVVSRPRSEPRPDTTPAPVAEFPNPAPTPAPEPQPEPAPVATAPAPARKREAPATSTESDDVSTFGDPAIRRPRPKRGHVKTRLLGFENETSKPDEEATAEFTAEPEARPRCPVGWLVVIEGPGAGEWFTLSGGLASIGRGKDQTVALDFGDMAISRQNHAALAYDPTDNSFLLGHGASANTVLVNGTPLTGTLALSDRDQITIGETTLRLVALCDKTFNWQPKFKGERIHAETA